MSFIDGANARKELECYMYCLYQSLEHFKNKQYGYAAVYLENAARSLKALEELKVNENQSDHVVTFIATIRSNDGNS